MTKIILNLKDNILYFEAQGHSDYKNDDTGNNDVCVAVSTLCSMLVRFVAERGKPIEKAEDGHVVINIPRPTVYIETVFDAAMLELMALEKEYPEHIKLY